MKPPYYPLPWKVHKHSWSESSIIAHNNAVVATSSIEIQATEENQDELESLQAGVLKMAVNAINAQYCETCQGHGVIGGIRGQTAESYEEVVEPCPECQSVTEMDGNLKSVTKHALECAEAWRPDARLIGNCRAVDLAAIFRRFSIFLSLSETETKDHRWAKWQPISTAPKDGSKFLALLKDSDLPHSVYFKPRYGWCIAWDGHILSDADGPTHWMKLPDPPQPRTGPPN
jgi:hypothetical protein